LAEESLAVIYFMRLREQSPFCPDGEIFKHSFLSM